MRWITLSEDYDIEEGDLFDDEYCVKGLKEVQLHLEDGNITSVVIEVKDGFLIEIGSRETSSDGCRKPLYVTTNKGDSDV